MFHQLSQLVLSEFRLRYQGSILGYFWTLIKPLLLFVVIYVVFSVFLASSINNYAVYLLLGIILWTFFQEATSTGLQSLLNNRELISKLNFPRENLVLATNISAFITLLLNLIIFAVFYLTSGFSLNIDQFLFVFYLILFAFFTAGISLILSILFVRFHDLKHIWEVLLQILFWLTPIIYDPLIIPKSYRSFLSLNPIAKILSYCRNLLFSNQIPSLFHNFLLALGCLAVYVIGLLIFKKYSPKIAELI